MDVSHIHELHYFFIDIVSGSKCRKANIFKVPIFSIESISSSFIQMWKITYNMFNTIAL
jgi:hypothetical protein